MFVKLTWTSGFNLITTFANLIWSHWCDFSRCFDSWFISLLACSSHTALLDLIWFLIGPTTLIQVGSLILIRFRIFRRNNTGIWFLCNLSRRFFSVLFYSCVVLQALSSIKPFQRFARDVSNSGRTLNRNLARWKKLSAINRS